jgi:hypothetical protein
MRWPLPLAFGRLRLRGEDTEPWPPGLGEVGEGLGGEGVRYPPPAQLQSILVSSPLANNIYAYNFESTTTSGRRQLDGKSHCRDCA